MAIPNPQPNINDTIQTDNTTWSSNKINGAISSGTGSLIDDTATSDTKTWSSNKISNEITTTTGALIDDNTEAENKTWSSSQIALQISTEYLNLYVTDDDILEAGETTLTFTSPQIEADSLIDIYTNDFSVYPTAASQTDGELELTFTAQLSDIAVSIRIWFK